MKKSIFFFCAFFTIMSCNETPVEAEKTDTFVEKTVVFQEPNLSEIDMDIALAAFEEGNYTEAAAYIDSVVVDIKKETEVLTVKDNELLRTNINQLSKLANSVRDGDIKDAKVLTSYFAQAEMNAAHCYMIFSEMQAEVAPEKSKSFAHKALQRLKNAQVKFEDGSKSEVDLLIKNTEKMLGKDKEINAKTMRKQIERFGESQK